MEKLDININIFKGFISFILRITCFVTFFYLFYNIDDYAINIPEIFLQYPVVCGIVAKINYIKTGLVIIPLIILAITGIFPKSENTLNKIIFFISNLISMGSIMLTYRILRIEILNEDNILLKFKGFNIYRKISIEEKTETYLETYINYLNMKGIDYNNSSIILPKQLEVLSKLQIEKLAINDAKLYIENLLKINKNNDSVSTMSTISHFIADHKGMIIGLIIIGIGAYLFYKFFFTNNDIIRRKNLEKV